MTDKFANITLNGKPLSEILRQERLREIERHISSEGVALRQKIARGRSAPVPLAAQKRGRKLLEVRPWVLTEIRVLAADQSLTVNEIARRTGHSLQLVRMCLRRLSIKRKRGRKKSDGSSPSLIG